MEASQQPQQPQQPSEPSKPESPQPQQAEDQPAGGSITGDPGFHEGNTPSEGNAPKDE